MIFPTDPIIQLRGTLEDRVSSGELSEAEAYREALAADPHDPRALRLLALLAEDEEDFATASNLAWRWLPADPLSHEVFTLIGRLLLRDPSQAARATAYRQLGREKLHFDPEAETEHAAAHPIPVGEEPPAVTHELEPHRLLHSMWIASTGEIDRELVERSMARGADLAPLLTGILNLYGEDLLDEVDDALVVRALALLGEIGDPGAIPALAQFLPLEDETLSHVANWSLQRLSFRKPSETLACLNQLIPGAAQFDLAAIAQQVCTMPAIPGRTDAILAIEARLPEFEGVEHAALVLSLITSVYVMEGLASPLARRMMSDYGDLLPGEPKRELQKIRRELKDLGPYIAEEDDVTVYDLCCDGFDSAEEDEPFVRGEPKLGRNDPCWCGSGKKYKKCHLAANDDR